MNKPTKKKRNANRHKLKKYNFIREMISDWVKSAERMAPDWRVHKANKYHHENSVVSKQINFVLNDNESSLSVDSSLFRIFPMHERILYCSESAKLKVYNVALKNTQEFNLLSDTKIIDCTFNGSSRLFYITDQLRVMMFDYDIAKSFARVKASQFNPFLIDLKPYIPVSSSTLDFTSFSAKILSISRKVLVVNLTPFCNRVLVINLITNSITYNISLDPSTFSCMIPAKVYSCFAFLVKTILESDYSLVCYHVLTDYYSSGVEDPVKFLDIICDHNPKIPAGKVKEAWAFLSTFETPDPDDIFHELSISKLIREFHTLLQLLHEFSYSYENNEFDKTSIFKLIQRLKKKNIDLKSILVKRADSISIEKSVFVQILVSLPVGMTEDDILSIVEGLNKTKTGEVIFPFLFDSREYAAVEMVHQKKNNSLKNQFYHGFFNKATVQTNESLFDNSFKRLVSKKRKVIHKRRFSEPSNFSTATEIEGMSLQLVGMQFKIRDFVYLNDLKIFFILLDYRNVSRIAIVKVESQATDFTAYHTEIKALGFIETFSSLNPGFIHYIPSKNLLFTQSVCPPEKEFFSAQNIKLYYTEDLESCCEFNAYKNNKFIKNTTTYDIISIDIYRDILDVYQLNKPFKVFKYNRYQNRFDNKILNMSYLYGSELLVAYSQSDLIFVSTNSKTYDLSVSYFKERTDMGDKSLEEQIQERLYATQPKILGDKEFKTVKQFKFNSLISVLSVNYKAEFNYDFDYVFTVESYPVEDNQLLSFNGFSVKNINIPVKLKEFSFPVNNFYKVEEEVKYEIEEIKGKITRILKKRVNERSQTVKTKKNINEFIKTFIIYTKYDRESLVNEMFEHLYEYLEHHKSEDFSEDLFALMARFGVFFSKKGEKEEEEENTEFDSELTKIYRELGLNQYFNIIKIMKNNIKFQEIPKDFYQNILGMKYMNSIGKKVEVPQIEGESENVKFNDILERLGKAKKRERKESKVTEIEEYIAKILEQTRPRVSVLTVYS